MKTLKEQLGEYPTVMHNPGDLRPPDGVVKGPSKRVLILRPLQAVRINRSQFDAVVPLPGSDPSVKDEQAALAETTHDSSR